MSEAGPRMKSGVLSAVTRSPEAQGALLASFSPPFFREPAVGYSARAGHIPRVSAPAREASCGHRLLGSPGDAHRAAARGRGPLPVSSSLSRCLPLFAAQTPQSDPFPTREHLGRARTASCSPLGNNNPPAPQGVCSKTSLALLGALGEPGCRAKPCPCPQGATQAVLGARSIDRGRRAHVGLPGRPCSTADRRAGTQLSPRGT